MFKIEKTYTIGELADRFCKQYKSITGNSNTGKSKVVIRDIIFVSLNRKVYIQNFKDVCASINREPQDVSTYIQDSLHAETSILKNGSLCIHKRYFKNDIENTIRKYVKESVQCPLCNSQNTRVEKLDRIAYIICSKCNAKKAIST
jgi:translation initiation factor 2 subunit 2